MTTARRSPDEVFGQTGNYTQDMMRFSYNSDNKGRGADVAVDLSRVPIPKTTLPDHWCSVVYYELDTQIGETFKVHETADESLVSL